MIEKRLEIIKENVYMRSEIAKNSRLGIDTSLGEELELLKEIERLNNIINELEKYIHNELVLDFYNDDMPCELIINKMEKMIKKLKDSD